MTRRRVAMLVQGFEVTEDPGYLFPRSRVWVGSSISVSISVSVSISISISIGKAGISKLRRSSWGPALGRVTVVRAISICG